MIRITGNWLRESSDRETTAKRLYPITQMLDKEGLKLSRVWCNTPFVDIGTTRFAEPSRRYHEPFEYERIGRQFDERTLDKQLYELLIKGFYNDPLQRLIRNITYIAPRKVRSYDYASGCLDDYELGDIKVTYENEQRSATIDFEIRLPGMRRRLSFGPLTPTSYKQEVLREAGRTDRVIVTARFFENDKLEEKIAKLR